MPIAAHCYGLLAGPAEAVQRHTRRGHRPTCVEHRHARDVHRVIADPGTGTHHDVLDVLRIETDAILQCIEHLREDPLRVNVAQFADLGLAAAAR